ncbi:ceramide kinase-like protein [Lates japonicus]|uniref:Ceramide kinase-like protein n=1 Tax=Lates japonicus TaxID=270547 RepID=A0AAD3N851_LATJO|nr:ceramide kinase-like protein [Lates japonicus]
MLLQDVFAVKVAAAAGQQSGGRAGVAVLLREDGEEAGGGCTSTMPPPEHTQTWVRLVVPVSEGVHQSLCNTRGGCSSTENMAPLFKMADIRIDITVCQGGVLRGGWVAELCRGSGPQARLDIDSPETSEPVLQLRIIPCWSAAGGHVQLFVSRSVGAFRFLRHVRLRRSELGAGGKEEVDAVIAATRVHALVKTLARLRPEDCQLSFLPAKNSTGNLFQHRDDDQDVNQDPESEGEESWTTNQGLYLSISIMSIPCLSPHAPRGLAPNTSLANGSAALIAVGNTSRSEFIKHLKRYSSSSGQFSFSFVETHAVSAVRIRPCSLINWSEEESEEEGDSKTTPIIQSEGAAFPWNIDGELVEIANEVLVRVHPRLITLYGEEVDEAESTVSCSCI